MVRRMANTGDHDSGEKFPHTGDHGDDVSKQDYEEYKAWLEAQRKKPQVREEKHSVASWLKERRAKKAGKDGVSVEVYIDPVIAAWRASKN